MFQLIKNRRTTILSSLFIKDKFYTILRSCFINQKIDISLFYYYLFFDVDFILI